MLTAINHEIVSMFEEAGMLPEDISQDTGYDVTAIKAILLQFSKVYRDLQKEKQNTDKLDIKSLISDNELSEMLDVVKSLARYSEYDNVRLKAAERIIDEKEDRLSAVKEVRNANYNLILFNQQVLANRRAKEKVLELTNKNE